MPSDTTRILIVTILVFGCATLLAFSAMAALARRERTRRRYDTLGTFGAAVPFEDDTRRIWASLDPSRFGLDTEGQRALRTDLVRAGFFDHAAVGAYAATRLALIVGLPIAGALLVPVFGGTWGLAERAALGVVLLIIGIILPRAYLARRRGRLEQGYRVTFPDFLDMLVVCINAGLSLEAALDRTAREVEALDPAFRANLGLMAGEMRAGKSTPDALKTLADRLGLREARSFAALLQQTIELGTDVSQALTIFSDDMRDRRMARAEEKAASLPPKLTLPLGLFIFPVVLIAVLAPAVLKIMSVVAR